MPTDPRFLASNTREVFTGNELLVKGCLETPGGVSLLTGYPGSPVAGFFDALGDIKEILQANGMRAFQANNEALAIASINGSQMLPCKAIAAMKNVGVHVAADALYLGNLAGANPGGGVVVIMGDDPWCESTQVPADSRFICEHLRMPVVEPGDIHQTKDWIAACFELSQAAGLYIGYILTPAQADGGGSVLCKPNHFPSVKTTEKVELDSSQICLDKVLLPPRTWQHELAIPERFAQTMAAARRLGVNRLYSRRPGLGDGVSELGFVISGMAGPYLWQVLREVGLDGAFPILQLGMSYPTDVSLVTELASQCRRLIVVEERRPFMEKAIVASLLQELPREQATEICGRIYGKQFPNGEGIPSGRGLNYSVLAQKILPLIQEFGGLGGDELEAAAAIAESPLTLPSPRCTEAREEEAQWRKNARQRIAGELARLGLSSRQPLAVTTAPLLARTATFCPGCPHRDSASVLLELRKKLADAQYMRRAHNRAPVDLVAHGDTGCYTMLMFPPTEQLMHNYSGMGLGGGTGSGIDPFIKNKQIVFMGDSTFFHSGQLAITNTVKAGGDLTYIILQNGTTAMTGHQDHAGLEEDMFGNRHGAPEIEQMVRGMAAHTGIKVFRLSPADRDNYGKVLEETILADGVKVIIADKECGITFHRSQLRQERQIVKEKGYLPKKTHMNITPEVCENCLECTKQTACPGLTTVQTDYGPKIDTDLTWCVNDGACERVQVSNSTANSVKPCPSFEEVTIVHSRRRRYRLPNMSLDKLPDPTCLIDDLTRPGGLWRCHMSGVGGMGIGLVAAILVRAGHTEGYNVVFQDKKGLAIRNGGVFSQIAFSHRADDAQPGDRPFIETAVTGNIPYGGADLLLGVDILEAARAVDPREAFRVANPQRTAAVLNLHKQPTVSTLLGNSDFDPEELRQRIYSRCRQEHCYAKNLSEICEQRLGSKQFVNIMMLGVAFQLGLIPVSAHAIAWAIRDTIRREHRRNLKAFNIGRKLALEPRALPRKPQPETWDQLLTNKARILRKTRVRGARWASHLEVLVNTAMGRMKLLPEQIKYNLAVRIYDILEYEDQRMARRYVQLIDAVYRSDSAENHYAVTDAAIMNLAKVILIKDEPYVAYLLTRYEKKQRDITKFAIDVNNGDRLVYCHHTSPELNIGPWRIRIKLKTRPWMLQVMRHFKWLRRLPGWHQREATFRDWYIGLLGRINIATPAGYQRALRVLRSPENISGYREIRYPKMSDARRMVEEELAKPNAAGAGTTVTV